MTWIYFGLAEILFTMLPSAKTAIKYKKENRASSVIPVNKKTKIRVELLMNKRLKTNFQIVDMKRLTKTMKYYPNSGLHTIEYQNEI
jgi:hypothetical protein